MLTKNTEIIELNNYEEKEQVTADVKQLKSKLKLEPQQIIKKKTMVGKTSMEQILDYIR